MRTRMMGLLVLLFASVAAAQQPEEPWLAPPLVSPEPSCGVCSAGAQCVEGQCQFACATNRDCKGGHVCVTGRCEAKRPQRPGSPPTIRRADGTHAERYRFSSRVPAGFHLVSEPLWGVFAGGLAAFAAGYLPFAIIGGLGSSPLDVIPFVGPILSFQPDSGWFSAIFNVAAVVGIAIDVIIQLGGVAAVIASLAAPRRWLERDEPKPVAIFLLPGAAGTPLGASLAGRF